MSSLAMLRAIFRLSGSAFSVKHAIQRVPANFRNGCELSACASFLHNHQIRQLSSKSEWHGLWEPTDLKTEPDIPEYEAIHICMRGFDFPVLESYAKYVHRAAKTMFELESDAWPVPAKSTQVRTFHPRSSAVNDKYDLQKFERIVMIEDVPTTTLPIILEFVRKNCPAGVEVCVKEPTPEEEEERFVPDYEVIELQKEKEAIAAGKLRKK